MKPEEILVRPSKVLDQDQRQFYFEQGYLHLPEFISKDWLDRLTTATEEMIEGSRKVIASNEKFDLETGHSAEQPRLRRLTSPVDHHPAYWEFVSNSSITDLAEDLLGPNVKYHHSKLNFKAGGGGVEVKWHQDFPFLPHTNSCVLTIGVYLTDVDETMSPLKVVPRSHQGELFPLYNDKEQWVGAIHPRDLPSAGIDRAVPLTGKAGSVTVHNARMVHGSSTNSSSLWRPLLLYMLSAGDAMPITYNPITSRYHGYMLRGRVPKWVEFEPGQVIVPPDFRGVNGGIFALQYQ